MVNRKDHSLNSQNQDESSIETDDKNPIKSNSTITCLSSEEMLAIQSKDINEQTKILCNFFSQVNQKEINQNKKNFINRTNTLPKKN